MLRIVSLDVGSLSVTDEDSKVLYM